MRKILLLLVCFCGLTIVVIKVAHGRDSQALKGNFNYPYSLLGTERLIDQRITAQSVYGQCAMYPPGKVMIVQITSREVALYKYTGKDQVTHRDECFNDTNYNAPLRWFAQLKPIN